MLDKDGFQLLQPVGSEYWKKVKYQTKQTLIVNKIFEYDIRSANTSALRNRNLMKPSTLDELEQLPKHDREVRIGKMIVKDKSLKDVIASEIRLARMFLFRENDIHDDEVIGIKNDAVYVVGRRLKHLQFGHMRFVEKHAFAAYLWMENLEIYYDRKNRTVDIKGIKDSVLADPDHQNGMLTFLAQVMEYLSMDRRDALRKYLIEFSNDYKSKKLPICFYKEMNGFNIYRIDHGDSYYTIQMNKLSEEDKHMVSGTYNYMRFILPAIKLFV